MSEEIVSNAKTLYIYEYIVRNPGISFRSLCMGVAMLMSEVQYHLKILESCNAIQISVNNRFRSFSINKSIEISSIPELQYIILEYLNNNCIRIILDECIKVSMISRKDLSDKCGISRQGISFHCRNLKTKKILRSIRVGKEIHYILTKQAKGILTSIKEKELNKKNE